MPASLTPPSACPRQQLEAVPSKQLQWRRVPLFVGHVIASRQSLAGGHTSWSSPMTTVHHSSSSSAFATSTTIVTSSTSTSSSRTTFTLPKVTIASPPADCDDAAQPSPWTAERALTPSSSAAGADSSNDPESDASSPSDPDASSSDSDTPALRCPLCPKVYPKGKAAWLRRHTEAHHHGASAPLPPARPSASSP